MCQGTDPASKAGAVSAVGFRAVPLKNNYSENLELASLLVKIDIFPSKVRTGEHPALLAPAAAGLYAAGAVQQSSALPGEAACRTAKASALRWRGAWRAGGMGSAGLASCGELGPFRQGPAWAAFDLPGNPFSKS